MPLGYTHAHLTLMMFSGSIIPQLDYGDISIISNEDMTFIQSHPILQLLS
jgi:hypothetical protein